MQGVTEADNITREKHPRAVPMLVQLGHLFARTSRVTLAEGIYRSGCCSSCVTTAIVAGIEGQHSKACLGLTPHAPVLSSVDCVLQASYKVCVPLQASNKDTESRPLKGLRADSFGAP